MHEYGQGRLSISFQIFANWGSVSAFPPILASTITPTAPLSQDLCNSCKASCSCCHGNDANQRMRSGQAFCAFAMSSFMMRAPLRLTSGAPQ